MVTCPRCNGSGTILDDRVVGAELRALRIENGITLRSMARVVGKSVVYLSDLELGRRRWNKNMLDAYAQHLPSNPGKPRGSQ